MSEVYHQACPQSKICHVCRGFFCRQRLFCLCFKPTGSTEMITEKCCAGANVVCPADSIRACWCSHSLKHRERKYRSILQSHCFLMLYWEFTVDFKNWQICAVAYKFGLLLPLLLSGDMNKFLSKRNVLSVELFSIMSSDLGLFAASWLGAQAEWAGFSMKLCAFI